MNNIINIFFLFAHYTLYAYIMSLIYKKFVRPYLMQEQQQERALMVQLQHRLFTMQALIQTFKNQVEYLTTVFEKISEQQQQAHHLNQKRTEEYEHMQSCIKVEYAKQLKAISHGRELQRAYQELAPEIIQQLSSQLKSYAQDNGERCLNAAIKALKEQSQLKSKK
ncbi:MAG: hypothetical protein K2X90_04270 [Candidatus Babeliaceae bacterium]|nr:hypothetical protein [Candidatus Babeliaceae bacterium]